MVLVPLLLLTACASPFVVNDVNNECDHPNKPDKPYTDTKVAGLIVDQSKAIDKCKALLGKKLRLK